MKEVITDVNRVDDEENDLIYANEIKMGNYLKFNKDEFGREVIVFDD